MQLKYIKYISLIFISIYTFCAHSNEKITPLGDNEGYALVAIYSQGYAEKIKLDGEGFGNNHDFGPLNDTQYLKVYPLKAGEYNWSQVVDRIGENTRVTYDFDDLDLKFTIQPGKVNYIGLLMFKTTGSKFSAEILNRTSMILTIFKQQHSELFNQYQVVNGIYPNDPYISFFLNGNKGKTQ
ncbi:hypothetical protein PSECIP111951_02075 [Pseudoalteromonas holothuriae]|uniref:DUF2846 domain-containing protein n=1 Tax=Pseudoalteromonas holothuriae TaxID=2963714 RepID=A0ABM9GI98_9GAMM|nr:hypothetical protein PSECIP111951_02075 [Pseudoalteromonas sp. CIP111951]